MNDLIRSEWRRFRRLTLLAALAHGLALLLLSRVVDLPQLGYEEHAAMLLLYMLLGLGLALLQVGSYRPASRWLWLIHRPLPPPRIFAALALAALAVLAMVILLPLLVFLLATDLFTSQVVDSRHYVALFHVIAFAMMAWLAGAHACASRHRAAVAVLLAPLLLALHLASVWALLVPVLLCLLWLAYIAAHSFRADRDAPIGRHRVLLLTALPLQLGFFVLVFQLSKFGAELADMIGRGPPGRTVLAGDPEVDIEAEMRSFSQAFLAKGLEHSRDPRAAAWREQLPLLEVAGLAPDLDRFPVRHQISNLGHRWWDEQHGIEWTFSHDRMQFLGRDPRSGEPRGSWGRRGAGEAEAFTDLPVFGMTRDTLYAIDDPAQRQYELVRLPAGEWFIARPSRALDHLLLQTNRRLLAYAQDRDASPFDPPRLAWQLPTAAAGLRPIQIDVAELLDGWLVSMFYYDGQEFDGFETLLKPWQQVVFVDTQGRARVVGERRDIRDHQISMGGSIAAPLASWWVSPPLYALAHLPSRWLDSGLTQPPRFEPLPAVPLFYPLALGLMLASLLAGHVWLRGIRIGPGRRRLWLASCALLGLPALLSLVCLEPRIPRN